ncbi:MAG TPA: ribbon-helix-helix domain-containing protein [Lacipirellulaceae bacterium]|nr:ribbon-helix-helix domain-containing protein [Lacipirellulaceae bacterium]
MGARIAHCVLCGPSGKTSLALGLEKIPRPRVTIHNRVWKKLWSIIHIMETVQIVIDRKLLTATDRAARRMKSNRSALVRDALREHLQRLEIRSREESDRIGYARQPADAAEVSLWEAEAAWPEE